MGGSVYHQGWLPRCVRHEGAMLGVLNSRQRRERRETRPSVRSVFSCWIWRLRCIARTGGAPLDIPTIAELSCSLSLRGTSGERDGEGYSIKVPSSPQPS